MPRHVRFLMHVMNAWHASKTLCHNSHVKRPLQKDMEIIRAKINTVNTFYVLHYYVLMRKMSLRKIEIF